MSVSMALVKVGSFAIRSIFWNLVGTGFSWLGSKIWPLLMGSSVMKMMKAPGKPGEYIAGTFAAGSIPWYLGGCGFAWLGAKVWSLFMGSNVMMKAPGKPGEYIVRKAFEKNPAAYFRSLRGA